MTLQVSGFTIVRNASILDFPLEPSLRSLLPAVDELVVNVGASEDDTLERVRAIADPRIRVIESTWDMTAGTAVLAVETQRAMAACRFAWGIYLQADEVFADGAAERLRRVIELVADDLAVEGVVVDYVHFYGGFGSVATNRKWYRREIRAIRLGAPSDIRSFRDAQGFRAGAALRRLRCVASGAVIHHYGWARPAWALAAKRARDREINPARDPAFESRPLLPWFPGIVPFHGSHPRVAAEWIASRRAAEPLVSPPRPEWHHLRLRLTNALERLTGWRPFEFRNYDLTKHAGLREMERDHRR